MFNSDIFLRGGFSFGDPVFNSEHSLYFYDFVFNRKSILTDMQLGILLPSVTCILAYYACTGLFLQMTLEFVCFYRFERKSFKTNSGGFTVFRSIQPWICMIFELEKISVNQNLSKLTYSWGPQCIRQHSSLSNFANVPWFSMIIYIL